MTVFGMIGASTIGEQGLVAPARRLGVEVAAVASPRPHAAGRYAQEHGIPAAFTSYDRLLADDAIDAVYISTAASNHVRDAAAALRAGKHVLCEKPIAVDLAGAELLQRTAEENGRVLMEGFHYRFHPLFQRLLALIHDGELGALRMVESQVGGIRPFQPGSILHEKSLGGGALLHNGVYAIHWSRLLLDAEPLTASAEHTLNPSGADSETRARLIFPEGRIACLSASFDRDAAAGATLTFDRGVVEVEGLIAPHHGHLLTVRAVDAPPRHERVDGPVTFDLQIREFLGRVAAGRISADTGGDDIVANLRAVDAVRRSAAAGHEVTLA